ncbi:MAG: hypothetical protein U1G07_01875 [Verrucomicrobiota bacterium]
MPSSLTFLALSVWQAVPLAQTASPERTIRNTTLAGSALEATAAFEAGMTYVAWRDTRNEGSSHGDIFAQKLGPDGETLWTVNGLAVCTAADTQSLPAIVPDGAGGAVVSWMDERARPKAIFAQRITSAGEAHWAMNGVAVGPVYLESPYSFVHRSSDGGFLVTWWDSAPYVGAETYPVLAQKLDATGTKLWDPGEPDGRDLWGSGIEAITGITRGRSVSDEAGGIIAIGKIRDNKGFRFQRVRSDGSAAWPAAVDFNATLPETAPFHFAADGAGGVIVAFLDNRDVRAFRVAGDGTLPWGQTGVTLVQANALLTEAPFVTPNGTGGAFVSWIASNPHDVRVQQIAADGSHLWAAGGTIVPDGSTSEREAALIRDGTGGIYLSFTTATSLRGQQLDRNGGAQWKINGSNGVGLGSGELSVIGKGDTGPNVVYKRSTGLFAKSIQVASPLRVLKIVMGSDQISVALDGGVPGRSYEVLRSATSAEFRSDSWKVVGKVQAGQTWTDLSPLHPAGFYGAREASP